MDGAGLAGEPHPAEKARGDSRATEVSSERRFLADMVPSLGDRPARIGGTTENDPKPCGETPENVPG
jgi:hypothetical protein